MQMPPGSARLSSRAATLIAVTVDLIALDHHVAEVDADAKLHPALRRQLRILGLERGLNIDRTIHRLDHAGELGQNAIAAEFTKRPWCCSIKLSMILR